MTEQNRDKGRLVRATMVGVAFVATVAFVVGMPRVRSLGLRTETYVCSSRKDGSPLLQRRRGTRLVTLNASREKKRLERALGSYRSRLERIDKRIATLSVKSNPPAGSLAALEKKRKGTEALHADGILKLSIVEECLNSDRTSALPLGATPTTTPLATPVTTVTATVTVTPPVARCGDGVIDENEDCDPGAFSDPYCDSSCRAVCPTSSSSSSSSSYSDPSGFLSKTLRGSSPDGRAVDVCKNPPLQCAEPYKLCLKDLGKKGSSSCCYDPESEDCVTHKEFGHPVAQCVPKTSTCSDPTPQECKSGSGARRCCKAAPAQTCGDGGGFALCSNSQCTADEEECKTDTGLTSSATFCCRKGKENCNVVFVIPKLVNIRACEPIESECIKDGGTPCPGSGGKKACCPAGKVCSPSSTGAPNCVDAGRVLR